MNTPTLRISIFALWMVGLALMAQAQEVPAIQFEETSHDFGTQERGAPTEHTFVFTNVSDEPISLQRVKASCGCTTPSYTREAVQPGEKGEIKVKYDSNRIGRFTKSITVTYQDGVRPVVLYIKGKIEKSNSQAQIQQVYKRPMGNLAFDELVQNFGTLDSDKRSASVFRVRNNGSMPIKLGYEDQKNPEFDVAFSTRELTPGQTATITITAVGERFAEMGPFSRQLAINTSDQAMPEKTLSVSGVVNKVYTAEELAQLPNIEFEATSYQAGKVISGEKVVYAYKFTNTGQEDLIIESVKASCGCTATAPKDKVIPGGSSSEIRATFNTRGRRGKQAKSITVRSNDPDQGVIVLRLTAEVEADPFHMGNQGPAEGSN